MKDGFIELNSECKGQQFIMFPYLGGNGMSIMNLAKEFEKYDLNVWVAYPPGHLGSEGTLCNSCEELMDFYLQNVKNIIRKDCIFVGHSMGGVIAYLLAKRIYEEFPDKKPKALILSATPEPGFMKDKKISQLGDVELVEELYKIGGMPEEIMDNKELMSQFIPMFKSDYKVLEDIALIEPMHFNIPTEFIFCENDKMTKYENMLKWKKYLISTSCFCNMPKDAGHMYLNKYSDIVVKYVMQYINLVNNQEEFLYE